MPKIKLLNICLISGFLFLGGCFTQTAFAQNASKPNTKKQETPKRVRYNALTIDNEGKFWQNNVPFTGGFYDVLKPDPQNPNKPPVTTVEGFCEDGLLSGEYRQYRANGKFSLRETYVKGTKEGPFYYYYESGELEVKGEFQNGELSGTVQGYYKSGKIYYINNYKAGKRNGNCDAFFENGTKETESHYSMGIPVGAHYGFFPDGEVRYFKVFNDSGILNGPNYVFHRTGCAALEEYYKNGKLDSVQKAWDVLSCTIIKSGEWKNGLKNGTFVDYNMFGDTLKMQSFLSGDPDGLYIEYKEKDGSEKEKAHFAIETIGQFDSGYAHGYWKYGQVTSFQKREGAFDHGIKIGHWQYFDSEGDLLLEQWYSDKGELLEGKIYE